MRMVRNAGAGLHARLMVTLLIALTGSVGFADERLITPASMVRIGTVDERFQSYNIEMVEITGGRFWKPYRSKRG